MPRHPQDGTAALSAGAVFRAQRDTSTRLNLPLFLSCFKTIPVVLSLGFLEPGAYFEVSLPPSAINHKGLGRSNPFLRKS